MSALILTAHAVERYVKRVRPDLTYAAARASLAARLPGATRVQAKSNRGDLRYHLDDCVLIVKWDGAGLTVATIYALDGARGAGNDDVLAELRAETLAIVAASPNPIPTPIPTAIPTAPVKPAPKPPPPLTREERERAARQAHFDAMVAGKDREIARLRDHGERMCAERDGMKTKIRRLAALGLLLDTPETRAILGDDADWMLGAPKP